MADMRELENKLRDAIEGMVGDHITEFEEEHGIKVAFVDGHWYGDETASVMVKLNE